MPKPSLHVTIDARHPETHRLFVKISGNLPPVLSFPVWTPGSYLVREYSRHITGFRGGRKISKNKWAVTANAREVSYEVYANERTVRTSFIDENYAALVGATLLPLLEGRFRVTLLLPTRWGHVGSALRFKRQSPGRWEAVARDSDHWIDSPIVASAPGYGGETSFRSGGIQHRIVWAGTECARPLPALARDCKKIFDATIRMFGGAPFRRYDCLLHFGSGLYGGLEHRDSQLSQFDGSLLGEKKNYDNLLRLIAHEYFHAWNVKSLRPEALGPFRYEQENYTEDLWFAEGLTDYFDDWIVWKAGLIETKAYWQARLKDAQAMQDGLPGHKRRSVAESSFDAWIRYYRPDEDSWNTDVSYYSKGALVAWCWDAWLVKRSRGRWDLARLIRAFWKEFGVDAEAPLAEARPGYTRAELFAFAEKVTKLKQRELVESWVTARRPLPWRDAARAFGVKVKENVSNRLLHESGIQLQWRGTQALAAKVAAGSAAEAAGISAQDEILAIGADRLVEADKAEALWQKHAGRGPVVLTISRLGKLMHRRLRSRRHGGLGVDYVVG